MVLMSPAAASCLFEELRSVAVVAGVQFEPNLIAAPLSAFMTPGVFAAVRVVVGGLRCPVCRNPTPVRHGLRPHGSGRIQQFRCTASGCRGTGGGGYFTEYAETPLHDGTLLAHQWLAIWHCYHRRSDPP